MRDLLPQIICYGHYPIRFCAVVQRVITIAEILGSSLLYKLSKGIVAIRRMAHPCRICCFTQDRPGLVVTLMSTMRRDAISISTKT